MKNTAKISLNSAVIALLAIATVVISPSQANARRECFTQYGGGETCIDINDDAKLEVDKKIYNPKSRNYENNISREDGSNPYTFEKNEKIKFRITVKNKGDVTIENIKLEDIMPSILEYVSGDGDEKDDGQRVTFDKFDLDPDEEERFDFTAKVASTGIEPNEDSICVSNVAKAKGERKDNGDKEDDADYANFCIEMRKGRVLSSKERIARLPTTGMIDVSTVLVGSTSLGLILLGFGLRKIAKSEES